MEAEKQLRRNFYNANIALVGLLIWVLIEAVALWRAGQVWEQARWTAVECAVPSAIFCLLGIASIRNIRMRFPRSDSKQ
jgi:hypothetical protein